MKNESENCMRLIIIELNSVSQNSINVRVTCFNFVRKAEVNLHTYTHTVANSGPYKRSCDKYFPGR